ncbi:MAG: hypothetical protein PUD02_03090 [Eggerthellales bacterium]|nr:hypothetical protein [Eggerthellales bacterium]
MDHTARLPYQITQTCTDQGLTTYRLTVDSSQVDWLLDQADARLARALKTDIPQARTQASRLLTDTELESYYTTIVLSRTADALLTTKAFLFSPRLKALSPLELGNSFACQVDIWEIPHQEDGPSEALEQAALDLTIQEFDETLRRQQKTRAQWRSDHGMNTKGMDAYLKGQAQERLAHDICLEQTFQALGVSLSDQDRADALHAQGETRVQEAVGELTQTGKLWMLNQKARWLVAQRALDKH